jgi:hypothetical protein
VGFVYNAQWLINLRSFPTKACPHLPTSKPIGAKAVQIPKAKQSKAMHSRIQVAKSQCTSNETDILRTNKPTTANALSVVKM